MDLTRHEVVKSNDFNKHTLCKSSLGIKILYAIFAKVRKEFNILTPQNSNLSVELSLKSLSHCLSKNTDDFRKLKDALYKLAKSVHVVDNEKQFSLTTIFTQIELSKDNKYVRAQINSAYLKHICDLKSNFTKYFLEDICKINSLYSIRLYELLKERGYKVFTINVKDLKQFIGVEPSAYISNKVFNAKILYPKINEINKKTDIHCHVDMVKEGKTLIGYKFKIKDKNVRTDKK